MIRVYRDKGVNPRPLKALLDGLALRDVKTISAEEILHSDWEKSAGLLIIPGGRDVPYHEALNGLGNARIRQFVENGGSFLGICAGAYFGCGKVDFDRGMPLEVIGDRELGFFPGTAMGPAYGPGTFAYHSEKGAVAATISDAVFSEPFKVYYNGGCTFIDPHLYSQTEVISRYLDIPGKPAAIVSCAIGKGRAILSGVHFELGVSNSASRIPLHLRGELCDYEKYRKRFFDYVIKTLYE